MWYWGLLVVNWPRHHVCVCVGWWMSTCYKNYGSKMGSAIVAKRLVLPLLIGKVPIFQFLTNKYIKCFFLKCWQKFYMVLELTCQACSTYLSVYVVKNFIQKMKVFSFGYHTYLYMITFTFPTNYLVRTKSTTL